MTLVEKYIERLHKAETLADLNEIVDEAANDDRLTNGEYEVVYEESFRMIREYWVFGGG